jgi:hypothetical protein
VLVIVLVLVLVLAFLLSFEEIGIGPEPPGGLQSAERRSPFG